MIHKLRRVDQNRFGTFYHPHLLIVMPNMVGKLKVYINTRFEGHYFMTTSKAGHLGELAVGGGKPNAMTVNPIPICIKKTQS